MFKDVKKFVTIVRGQKFRQLMQLEPRYQDGLYHLAETLHPKRQILKISAISPINHNTTVFRFVSGNPKRILAPFRAGQYIGVKVNIDGIHTGRAFSILSSPNNLAYYEIAVKNLGETGFVSPFLCNELNVGDYIEATEPLGNLYYDPIFHGNRLVFIAGGIGITPFMSMTRNIYEKQLDFEIDFIFGCLKESDLVFHKELTKIAKECKNFNYIPVVTEPLDDWPGKKGYISKELISEIIEDVLSARYYAVGPEPMLNYLREQFQALGVPRHKITWDVNPPISDITKSVGWPLDVTTEKHVKCTVNWMSHGIKKSQNIEVSTLEPLLNSLERAKIPGLILKHSCRSGECAFCRTNLIKGEYFVPENVKIRQGDKEHGFIHPCVSYPLTDLEIEVYT